MERKERKESSKTERIIKANFTFKDAGLGYMGAVLAILIPQFILGLIWGIGVSTAGWRDIEVVQSESFAFLIISGAVLQACIFAFYFGYTKIRRIDPIIAPQIKKMPARNWLLSAAAGVVALFGLMFTSFSFDILMTDVIGYESASLPAFDTAGRAILGIIFMAALPAVIEELISRGMVLRGLSGLGKWKAVLISAALFSLMHMNPTQTVHQFLLGVVLALVAWETGSILAPMLIHFINNALAIILEVSGFFPLLENMKTWEIIVTALVTLCAACGIIYLILRFIKKPEGGTENRDTDGDVIRRKFTDENGALTFLLAGLVIVALMWIVALVSPFIHTH